MEKVNITALDDCLSLLEDVRNVLMLFDELVWDESRPLKSSTDPIARNFCARYEIMTSILTLAQIQLYDINETIRKELDQAYSRCSAQACNV